MAYTVEQVTKIIDDTNNRIIIACFADNTSMVIKDVSYENYTLPPGYKNKNIANEDIKPLLLQRKISYYTALKTQLTKNQ